MLGGEDRSKLKGGLAPVPEQAAGERELNEAGFQAAGSRVLRRGKCAGDVRARAAAAEVSGKDTAGLPISLSALFGGDGFVESPPRRPRRSPASNDKVGASNGAGGFPSAARPGEPTPVKPSPREFLDAKKALMGELNPAMAEADQTIKDAGPYLAAPLADNPDVASLDLTCAVAGLQKAREKPLAQLQTSIRAAKMENLLVQDLAARSGTYAGL